MAVQSKLYTATKNCRCEVIGTPAQVYDVPYHPTYTVQTVGTGNVAVLLGVDHNAQWVHIYNPQIHKDLQGNPAEIVGNISNVQGNFSLVNIPVSKLQHFPIFGPDNILPVSTEATAALTASYLSETAF